jgi:hypothetical protein
MSPPPNFDDFEGFSDAFFPQPSQQQRQTPSESPQEEGPVDDDDDDDDEDQLIKDGNDLIQRDLESRRKNREYSSRQVRDTQKKGDINKINLNFVDWSGFPAAAHSPRSSAERRRLSVKRASSLDAPGVVGAGGASSHEPPKLLSLRNLINREQKEKGKDTTTATGVGGEEDDGPGGAKSPHKYRNRRHSQRNLSGSSAPDSPKQFQEPRQSPPRRRLGAGSPQVLDTGGSHHRGERRERKGASSASKQPRPRRNSNPGQPSSPTSRLRRPIAAAASSTTLEIRKKVPQRTASGMRRNSTVGATNDGGRGGGGGLKSTSSGSLNEATGMRW